MADDDGYGTGVAIVGCLVGGVTFLGCWAYAIATYGWFLGLAFGWIPAAIIAYIVGSIAGLLWPLVLLAVFGLIWLIFKN